MNQVTHHRGLKPLSLEEKIISLEWWLTTLKQLINTLLDAYSLPKIEEIILKIPKNKVFSKIDLQSAYHQIPTQDSERHYTAFEACGKLYQFSCSFWGY
ncbi:hypothetical protein TNCV_2550401 [Trichonephila clavipes]|nr:hypothetical protein TNCV_2550401 [Trichonephila clavipes]